MGHALGLAHTPHDKENLMYPTQIGGSILTDHIKDIRCLVAGTNSLIYKGEKTKEELWAKYYIHAPRQHRQPAERYKIVKRA